MIWLKALLGIGEIGERVHNARVNLKLAELESKAASAMQTAQAQAQWETTAAQGAANSWKDEWFTVILSVPLILSFMGLHGVVEQGFERLQSVPDGISGHWGPRYPLPLPARHCRPCLGGNRQDLPNTQNNV